VSPSTAKARWAVGVAIVAAFAAVAFVWSRRPAPFALEPDADQNVVLVTIDTLRADALGSYGGRAATPNLDRLASNGARFTFAHAHAVVTLPSHTSILTGLLPYEHGMRDNSGYRVREGTETLATRLKPLGFATAAFVGGFPLTKRFGLTPGFDVYDDQIPEMRGDITFTMPERRADAVVSRAVDWIGKQEGKFFAWVHVFDPHLPYAPPDGFASTYTARPYDGEVAWTDHALGPLLERLTTAPRRTTVIVTSDHGESLGEHGEMTHGMFAYEATLRVPLIVATIDPRAASRAAGVVIDSPARHVDIAPTVLETIGATSDTDLSGSSLLDVIRDGRGDNRPTYFESMTYNLVRGWAPLRGVLAGRQKFIDQPIVELYDLSSDPREEQNVAPQEPERLRVMVNTLRSFNVAPPNRPAQESSEATAALRSLGYVSGTAPQRKVYTEADDLKNLVTIDRDLHRASELFQNGNVPDAIALFESVIERRSDTADAYISLAHAYWETARPDVAVATLERALTNGAPDRDVRIRLALYLSESGIDTARAIALLETMPPTDVEALNGLGVAYGGAKRYPDAVRAFSRVLALDPTNALALQNIASMMLRQALEGRDQGPKLREAETFARRAIDADPALAKAYTTLGVVLAETGRKPEAIDSWKTAVELDGREFDALYNLTVLLSEAGRIDDARTYARQFVATAPPALYQPAIEQLGAFIGR